MNENEPQAHRVTWFAPDRPVEGNTINARPQPLLVVADNYRMALEYAREHDLGHPGERWIYVHEASQVRGRRGGRYVVVSAGLPGDWSGAKRLELRRILEAHGFEMVAES